METTAAAFITETLGDYVLAASAHRELAQRLGFASGFPILVPRHSIESSMGTFLGSHGIAPLHFSSVVEGDDPQRRSQSLAASLGTGAASVGVDPDASPATLARALFTSLNEGRPLVFAPGAATIFDTRASEGRAGHLVLAQSNREATVAALYAACTGKQFAVLDNDGHLEETLERGDWQTTIVVDEPSAFTKRFLARLTRYAGRQGDRLQPAILTGYSLAQLSAVVLRLLAHRDRLRMGGRRAEPEGLTPVTLRSPEPLEYYVLEGHGIELHLGHGDEVLCGAFPAGSREDGVGMGATNRSVAPGFDCESRCRYPNRTRASDVAVHALVVLSCDVQTFGDGFVHRESSVLLNLLNGWCSTVVAPFRHALLNGEIRLLADALIQAGYSWGQITERLNAFGEGRSSLDRPFVLLGDPEVVPSPVESTTPPLVRFEPLDDGVDIEVAPFQGRAFEIAIPNSSVSRLEGQPLVVQTRSGHAGMNDLHFAFRPQPAGDLGLLVFGSGYIPQPLQLRVKVLRRPSAGSLDRSAYRIGRLMELILLGLDPARIGDQARQLASAVATLMGCPRVVESVGMAWWLSRPEEFLGHVFREARHAALRELLMAMGGESLWISHRYSSVYANVRRLDDTDSPCAPCATCGNPTFVWSYEDWRLSARGPLVCIRCGILSDTPLPTELLVRFPPSAPIVDLEFRSTVAIENVSVRPVELSVAAQFNCWIALEISCEPIIDSFVLEPGESRDWVVSWSFAHPVPDDVLGIQLFALTADFDLYCFTQRLVATQRAPMGQPTPMATPDSLPSPSSP